MRPPTERASAAEWAVLLAVPAASTPWLAGGWWVLLAVALYALLLAAFCWLRWGDPLLPHGMLVHNSSYLTKEGDLKGHRYGYFVSLRLDSVFDPPVFHVWCDSPIGGAQIELERPKQHGLPKPDRQARKAHRVKMFWASLSPPIHKLLPVHGIHLKVFSDSKIRILRIKQAMPPGHKSPGGDVK